MLLPFIRAARTWPDPTLRPRGRRRPPSPRPSSMLNVTFNHT